MASKENEIGSLKVRTVGKGANKVRVVLFPGREFGIEHFLPENLAYETDLSSRVSRFNSRDNPAVKFIRKTWQRRLFGRPRRVIWGAPLTALNEARLARFVNNLIAKKNIAGLQVEEPLAVHFHTGQKPVAFYRAIGLGHNGVGRAYTFLNRSQRERFRQLKNELRKKCRAIDLDLQSEKL